MSMQFSQNLLAREMAKGSVRSSYCFVARSLYRALVLDICLVGLLTAGCTALVNVSVNGYTRGEPALLSGKHVFIAKNEKASNPLLDEEVRSKLKRALTMKGFIAVDSPGEAALRLEYDYGVDQGRTFTEVTSSQDYQLNVFSGQFESVSHTSSDTTTVFTRKLFLRLYDSHGVTVSQPPTPVWVGEVTSRGSSSDLRRVIDFLIVAGVEHLGQNTGREMRRRYTFDEDPISSLAPQQ